jgi:hypothetical protein
VIAAVPELPRPACDMADEGAAPRLPDAFKTESTRTAGGISGPLRRQHSPAVGPFFWGPQLAAAGMAFLQRSPYPEQLALTGKHPPLTSTALRGGLLLVALDPVASYRECSLTFCDPR